MAAMVGSSGTETYSKAISRSPVEILWWVVFSVCCSVLFFAIAIRLHLY